MNKEDLSVLSAKGQQQIIKPEEGAQELLRSKYEKTYFRGGESNLTPVSGPGFGSYPLKMGKKNKFLLRINAIGFFIMLVLFQADIAIARRRRSFGVGSSGDFLFFILVVWILFLAIVVSTVTVFEKCKGKSINWKRFGYFFVFILWIAGILGFVVLYSLFYGSTKVI